MIHELSYERLLKTSQRINWRVEDVIGPDKQMDFSRPFLPESFARTVTLDFLNEEERLKLNHIRAFGYLAMFELVEYCILPLVEQHAPSRADQDPFRTPALEQFHAEELKHIELFGRFRRAFTEAFEVECGFIGPAEDIVAAVGNHGALGLALFVLGIEWSTQRHYVDSVRDDQDLDPQFKSLLKHHWQEESQHARLDALLFKELAAKSDVDEIARAVDDFLDIGGLVDGKLAEQTALDLVSLEAAIGRSLSPAQRDRFIQVQHQAMRWTFLGSAMRNEGFLDALGEVSPAGRDRIEQIAWAFC